MRLTHGTEQTYRCHIENIPFARRQRVQIGAACFHGRDNGMVVADFFAVQYTTNLDRDGLVPGKRQQFSHTFAEGRQFFVHFIGQVA